jgi:hypothetical protein
MCGRFRHRVTQLALAQRVVQPSPFGEVVCSENFMLKEDPCKNTTFRLRVCFPNRGKGLFLASSQKIVTDKHFAWYIAHLVSTST